MINGPSRGRRNIPQHRRTSPARRPATTRPTAISSVRINRNSPAGKSTLMEALVDKRSAIRAGGKLSPHLYRQLHRNDQNVLGRKPAPVSTALANKDWHGLGALGTHEYITSPKDEVFYALRQKYTESGNIKQPRGLISWSFTVHTKKGGFLWRQDKPYYIEVQLDIFPPDRIAENPTTGEKEKEHDRQDERAFVLSLIMPMTLEVGRALQEEVKNDPFSPLKDLFQNLPQAEGEGRGKDLREFFEVIIAEMFDRVGGFELYDAFDTSQPGWKTEYLEG